MKELDLIRRLLSFMSGAGGDLLIGPGQDDAAAWRQPDGTFVVATCDTSVEGVHFDLRRQTAEAVGWRALCFALGDLAAKGAAPTFGLVSLSMPRRWPIDTAVGIYRGLARLADEVGLRVVGGDTTATPNDGSLTFMLLGTTRLTPRPRSSVRPGWLVGVTGPLGAAPLAAAGLCCGDISDGLLIEMDKFAAAAGVGARIVLDAVPRVEGTSPEAAVASGEEVELVCCGPELPAVLHAVGELTAESRVVLLDTEGREVAVGNRGYDH